MWPRLETLVSAMRGHVREVMRFGGVTIVGLRSVFPHVVWVPALGVACLHCGAEQRNAPMPTGQDQRQLQDLGPKGAVTWLLANTLVPFAKAHAECVKHEVVTE